MHQGGGFAAGPLPEAGGTLDQAACVLAAFAIMSGAAAALKGGEQGGDSAG